MNRAAGSKHVGPLRPVQSRVVLLAVVVVERRDDVAPLAVVSWAFLREDRPRMSVVTASDDRINVSRQQVVRIDHCIRAMTIRDLLDRQHADRRRNQRRRGGRRCLRSRPG